jgi:hypothetical protein
MIGKVEREIDTNTKDKQKNNETVTNKKIKTTNYLQ